MLVTDSGPSYSISIGAKVAMQSTIDRENKGDGIDKEQAAVSPPVAVSTDSRQENTSTWAKPC